MAAITDKFNKAANGTGVYPSVASVTAIREQGGSILSCDDLAGWATDTAVHFSTYRLMADGTVDTSTQSDWKGIVSGNTITQMTHLAGNNDNGHLIGDKVELNPTISWLDDLITGILKSHNQDGTLKDNIIQAKHIVNGAISNTKLAAKAVKSENVDWPTVGLYKYSTEEQVIGTWLDGKSLYRKTFFGNTSSSPIVSGTTLNIDELISARGIIKTADNQYFAFPCNNSAAKRASVFMNGSGTKDINLVVGDYMNDQPYSVILEYTKNN